MRKMSVTCAALLAMFLVSQSSLVLGGEPSPGSERILVADGTFGDGYHWDRATGRTYTLRVSDQMLNHLDKKSQKIEGKDEPEGVSRTMENSYTIQSVKADKAGEWKVEVAARFKMSGDGKPGEAIELASNYKFTVFVDASGRVLREEVKTKAVSPLPTSIALGQAATTNESEPDEVVVPKGTALPKESEGGNTATSSVERASRALFYRCLLVPIPIRHIEGYYWSADYSAIRGPEFVDSPIMAWSIESKSEEAIELVGEARQVVNPPGGRGLSIYELQQHATFDPKTHMLTRASFTIKDTQGLTVISRTGRLSLDKAK